MKPEVLAEVLELEEKEDFGNPRYEELLMENYYVEHILRLPLDEWPVPIQRTFQHINQQVYTIMQGPSEFGIRGRLAEWDRTSDIHKIKVPTLVIGATYDTMDPKHMEWVASQLEKGEFLLCPKGSHLCNYDDHEVYFRGVIDFIKRVDEG
jgi:proline iminopeptidase